MAIREMRVNYLIPSLSGINNVPVTRKLGTGSTADYCRRHLFGFRFLDFVQ